MAQYLTTGAAYKLGVGREIAREVVTPRLRLGLPTGCARCLVSDLTCGRCSKVNLAVLLQDTARERLGRQHRTPAAGAAPRQHQEQGPGVRGAGDADSGARDDLRVLQAEPTGAQRPDRPGAAQRELRGGSGDGSVAQRATRRAASRGELVLDIGEHRKAHGAGRRPSARASTRLSQLGPRAFPGPRGAGGHRPGRACGREQQRADGRRAAPPGRLDRAANW